MYVATSLYANDLLKSHKRHHNYVLRLSSKLARHACRVLRALQSKLQEAMQQKRQQMQVEVHNSAAESVQEQTNINKAAVEQ